MIKTKRIHTKGYRVEGLNLIIDGGRFEGQWQIVTTEGDWIETLDTKKECINRIENMSDEFKTNNGIK